MLDAIAIPIEVHDRFSSVLDRFQDALENASRKAERGTTAFGALQRGAHTLRGTAVAASAAIDKAASSLQSARSDADRLDSSMAGLSRSVADAATGFLDAAGAYLRAGKSLAESLISGFVDTLSAQMNRALDALEGLVNNALSALGGALSGALGQVLDSSVFGFLGGLVSSVAGAIGSFFKKIFGKPSVEEYASESARKLASQFGIAFTNELEALIKQAAQRIADATGKELRQHLSEARFMPEVMQYVLAQMEDFGRTVQDQFARSLEHDTKAVLINIMKMTEGEAAQAMASTFEAVISKALETGNVLSDYMMRMIRWAQRLGAEISIPADAFSEALQQIIEAGEIGSEKFENLLQLAEQLGVSLQDGFQEGIETLRSQLDEINSQIISLFERQLDVHERRAELRESFVQAAAQELMAEDQSLSRAEARNQAMTRYKELRDRVSQLYADGVITLSELRAASEGMTKSEKETFLELVKQKQERKALHLEAAQESKLRETQRKLVQAINRLVKALGGEFTNATKTLATFQGSLDQTRSPDLGIASQLREARAMLRLFKKDLKILTAGKFSFQQIEGQGGFDYLFRGPASGYPVPVVLHGTERLTATPRGGGARQQSSVFNVTVHADSAAGGRLAAESFISHVQQALDTKRLRVPGYSVDTARI